MFQLMGGRKLTISEKNNMEIFFKQFKGLDDISDYDFDGKNMNFYDSKLNIVFNLSVYQLFDYDVLENI
jgi:hypothetical protein